MEEKSVSRDIRDNIEIPQVEKRDSVLSAEQVYHFLEEGYVLVSNLIPQEVCRRADEAMWRLLELPRDNPATWVNARRETFTEDPDLLAMYTAALLRAAGQLASEDPHMFPVSRVPTNAYILTIPPADEPWQHHGGHMDGSGDLKTNIVLSFPQPWTMFTMIYLHDIESHGGATMVWPKSHRKLRSLLLSRPERYRFLGQLYADGRELDFGKPLEIPARAGDVLFVDQMTWHAGSRNTSKRPRFAMNMKW